MTTINAGPQAVVLSGGGAYAAYEIGVMKALFAGLSGGTSYVPVTPQILTGTSAGAYNATFLTAQGTAGSVQAVEDLEQAWLSRLAGDSDGCVPGAVRYRLDPLTLFNPACFLRNPVGLLAHFGDDIGFLTKDFVQRLTWFSTSPGSIEERLLGLVDLSLLFADSFRTVIPETIRFQDVPDSPIALRIAATDWTTGKLKIYSNSEMGNPEAPLYVMASAATPGVFSPVTIGEDVYVDGGVLMNTPLGPAIDAGAGTLHVIYLDPDVANIPIEQLRNTLSTMDRIWVIQNAQSLNTDIETATRVNRGLEALRSAEVSGANIEQIWPSLVHFVGQVQSKSESVGSAKSALQEYKQLTIHRYHPDEDLGGFFGMLRFERSAIEYLIEKGYSDAIHHDCAVEGCIGPDGGPLKTPTRPDPTPASVQMSW